MSEAGRKLISWVVGIVGVIAIIVYFRPPDFAGVLQSIGVYGVIAWCVLTLLARLCLLRTSVEPVRLFGYELTVSDAFWIGWVRTFANQILPLSGVVAYAKALRLRTGISWSELAAMATPQFVLAAAALGVIGVVAVAINADALSAKAYWIGSAYLAIVVIALLITRGAAPFIDRLPAALSNRARDVTGALRKLASKPGLVSRLVAYHALVILLRGARLWVLFSAAGITLEWQQLLLVLIVAESSFLFQLTPGGLGVREAAVLGGAALAGIAPEIAAGVALIDRLFMIAITVFFAVPAMMILAPSQQIDN